MKIEDIRLESVLVVTGDSVHAGHDFREGDTVRAMEFTSDNLVRCEYLDGSDYWWVSPIDLEPAAPTREGDVVNHPSHYTHGNIEVIDAIEDWDLGFHLGAVIKYVARADHKGKPLEDLRKAVWFLEREIARREKLAAESGDSDDVTLASVRERLAS